MKICNKCGWYDTRFGGHRCYPELGNAAKSIALELPDVESTQLGYGNSNLAFKFDAGTTIVFSILSTEHLMVNHLFAGVLTKQEVVSLVRHLAAWRRENTPDNDGSQGGCANAAEMSAPCGAVH